MTVNAPLTINGDVVEEAGLQALLDRWWVEKEPSVMNAVEQARRRAAHIAARGSMVDADDASARLSGMDISLGLMP